jgi:hypothetical protein
LVKRILKEGCTFLSQVDEFKGCHTCPIGLGNEKYVFTNKPCFDYGGDKKKAKAWLCHYSLPFMFQELGL